ncbi:SHOCT domain-containing protein [Candidatus Saccharibacteria bacterium]|nr:SHOCT domain-containing protein [Candidatus Saccharibacteria bacterium]
MPGLLRGVARTAAVAGTATAVSNRVSRRQAKRWSDQGQVQPGYMEPVQYQQASPQAPSDDTAAQLEQLAQLVNQGILTPEEFTAKKKQLLGI